MPAKITLAEDVGVAQAAAQPADAGGREGEDAVGDAGRVHDVAHQDEQRRGEQRERVGRLRDLLRHDVGGHAGERDEGEGGEPHGGEQRHAERACATSQTPRISSIVAVTAAGLRRGRGSGAPRRASSDRRRRPGRSPRSRRSAAACRPAPTDSGRLTDSTSELRCDQAEAPDEQHSAEAGDQELDQRSRPCGGRSGGRRSTSTRRCGCGCRARGDDPADEAGPDQKVLRELVRPGQRAR